MSFSVISFSKLLKRSPLISILNIFATVFLCTEARTADISSFSFWKNEKHIVIMGEIREGDQDRFKQEAIRLLRSGFVVSGVDLLSPGGSVRTAMDIGDQIRLLEATTYAPEAHNRANHCRVSGNRLHPAYVTWEPETSQGDSRCTCQSACFLIWAAGISRRGDVVGIHRSWFTNKKWFGALPTPGATEAYANTFNLFRGYLRKFEIPENIIKELFATSSRSMRFLSKEQLLALRSMSFNEAPSAAKDELVRTRCGRRPSSEELGNVRVKFFDCVHDIYHGLAVRRHDAWIADRYLRKYAASNSHRGN